MPAAQLTQTVVQRVWRGHEGGGDLPISSVRVLEEARCHYVAATREELPSPVPGGGQRGVAHVSDALLEALAEPPRSVVIGDAQLEREVGPEARRHVDEAAVLVELRSREPSHAACTRSRRRRLPPGLRRHNRARRASGAVGSRRRHREQHQQLLLLGDGVDVRRRVVPLVPWSKRRGAGVCSIAFGEGSEEAPLRLVLGARTHHSLGRTNGTDLAPALVPHVRLIADELAQARVVTAHCTRARSSFSTRSRRTLSRRGRHASAAPRGLATLADRCKLGGSAWRAAPKRVARSRHNHLSDKPNSLGLRGLHHAAHGVDDGRVLRHRTARRVKHDLARRARLHDSAPNAMRRVLGVPHELDVARVLLQDSRDGFVHDVGACRA